MTALLLVLQLALLILMMVRFSDYFVYFYWFCILLSVVAVLYIVSDYSDPGYKIAWIIPILIFPVFGGLVYLLLGGNRLTSGMRRRMQGVEQQMADALPQLRALIEGLPNRKEETSEAAEIKIKYKGYIERERIIADKMHRLENIKIRGRFKYSELHEISTEGRQKLEKINPETLAQASRIPGVSPSDINVLLVLMGR